MVSMKLRGGGIFLNCNVFQDQRTGNKVQHCHCHAGGGREETNKGEP